MAKKRVGVEAKTLRDKLLDSALAEFGDKGYEGARVEEIAKLAGASKQALYHHFRSKEGIFAAAVEESYRRLRAPDAKIRVRLQSLDPKEALRELIEFLFKPSVETVRFQRIMHDENRFKGAHTHELIEAKGSYAVLIGMVSDILERGQRDGLFRADVDPREFYVFIAGVFVYRLTNAYTLSAMIGIPLDDDEGARLSRDAATEFLLNALSPGRT